MRAASRDASAVFTESCSWLSSSWMTVSPFCDPVTGLLRHARDDPADLAHHLALHDRRDRPRRLVVDHQRVDLHRGRLDGDLLAMPGPLAAGPAPAGGSARFRPGAAPTAASQGEHRHGQQPRPNTTQAIHHGSHLLVSHGIAELQDGQLRVSLRATSADCAFAAFTEASRRSWFVAVPYCAAVFFS